MTRDQPTCLVPGGKLEHVSTNRFALITAAAAAAVALSACSGTGAAEPKPWPSEGKVAAAPTTETVKPAANSWIGLPAAPVPDGERDTTGHRFGPLAPGVSVWEHEAGVATDAGCTLGPAVAPTMSPTSRGYLLAGHCDKPDRTQVLVFTDPSHASPRPVGVYTPAPSGGRKLDATSLWLQPGTSAPASIAGHPVAGVLTTAALKELVSGSGPAPKACVYGAVTGLSCGDLIDADDKEVTVDIPVRKGDSGSPMFLYDESARAVTVIGVLTDNSRGNTSYGVTAETALRSLGAKLVTDPAVAVDTRADARYSDQIVTGD